MFLYLFRFAKNWLMKYVSNLLFNHRNNRKNILWTRSISNLLSISSHVRKNYSNLHLNNCERIKCKHQSCVKLKTKVSNNESRIPKPKIHIPKMVSNKLKCTFQFKVI